MKKIEILVIGRNKTILETVVRLINSNPAWKGTGTCPDEDDLEKIKDAHFDIALLTNGIEEETEQKLRLFFTSRNPNIIILQHYGGGSGLLANEIWEALKKTT